MRIHRLIERESHRVTAHIPARPSDTLVIGFNPIAKGLADTGFGSDLVLSMGMAHVFVAEGAHSQYQLLTPRALRRALLPLLADHPRVFAYGASLGGHAALYYCSVIGARAIALAPRLPLHSCYRAFGESRNRRLTRGRLRHRDLPEIADPALSPVVLHDPWNGPDADYVDRFVRPAFPGAVFLPVRGAGHGVARVLARQGRLKPFIGAILREGIVGPLGHDPDFRPGAACEESGGIGAGGGGAESRRIAFAPPPPYLVNPTDDPA
ncbi:hypothetical protein [Pseudogemmobacter sonorensis]|uniref:hypothetical protein n=1 Tax=Pseudogemmobacter sonorensis TaxID=2989681 RepID=UPI0036C1FFBE